VNDRCLFDSIPKDKYKEHLHEKCSVC
jgi:hypothetical protein